MLILNVSLEAEEIQNLHHHDQRVPHFLCFVSNRVQEADWRLATLALATEHLEIPMPEFVFPQHDWEETLHLYALSRSDTRSFNSVEEEVNNITIICN